MTNRPHAQLGHGDWRDLLLEVGQADCLLSDPPFNSKTHSGWNAGEQQVRDCNGQATRQAIDYAAFTPESVRELVLTLAPRVRGWWACMTDDVLAPAYRAAYAEAGLYDFAPVPIIQKRPRLLGDGPASWAVYLMVARPKKIEFSRWGCLPGAYFANTESIDGICGAKPIGLMREIVRDYSRAGDLVLDPFAGSGTTLIAANHEGRRAVGCEIDPARFEIAKKRIDAASASTDFAYVLKQAQIDEAARVEQRGSDQGALFGS